MLHAYERLCAVKARGGIWKLRNKPTSSEIPYAVFLHYALCLGDDDKSASECDRGTNGAGVENSSYSSARRKEIGVNWMKKSVANEEFNEACILSPKREITVPSFVFCFFFCSVLVKPQNSIYYARTQPQSTFSLSLFRAAKNTNFTEIFLRKKRGFVRRAMEPKKLTTLSLATKVFRL